MKSRWLAVSIFGLFTALNFLSRQLLAALAPQIKLEFGLNNEQYGQLQSAFSIAYGLFSPFAGLMIDALGLSAGAMLTIAAWSVASTATALTTGLGGLLACRVFLGAAQGGGIPAFGKAGATYLRPEERGLGTAINQIGISMGSMGAPLLAGYLLASNWRGAFVIAGLAGLLWIPLWYFVRRSTQSSVRPATASPAASDMLRDPRLWLLVGGNMLVMTAYSLWINWINIFLVEQHHLSQAEVNRLYAWWPPLFATAGGLFGGWMAFRMARAGAAILASRQRAMLISVIGLMSTAAVPYMSNATSATVMMCMSFFFAVAVSANAYALPQDLFGAGRTAFGVAAMTFGYGVMQALYAPAVGWMADHYGFEPVCLITAALPLAGWFVFRMAIRRTRIEL